MHSAGEHPPAKGQGPPNSSCHHRSSNLRLVRRPRSPILRGRNFERRGTHRNSPPNRRASSPTLWRVRLLQGRSRRPNMPFPVLCFRAFPRSPRNFAMLLLRRTQRGSARMTAGSSKCSKRTQVCWHDTRTCTRPAGGQEFEQVTVCLQEEKRCRCVVHAHALGTKEVPITCNCRPPPPAANRKLIELHVPCQICTTWGYAEVANRQSNPRTKHRKAAQSNKKRENTHTHIIPGNGP